MNLIRMDAKRLRCLLVNFRRMSRGHRTRSLWAVVAELLGTSRSEAAALLKDGGFDPCTKLKDL